MIQIVKKARHIVNEWHYLLFTKMDRKGTGFSFPCNKDGIVNEKELSHEVLQRLKNCYAGLDNINPLPVIKVFKSNSYEPAEAICECKRKFLMRIDSEGLCYCDCGRCYNTAGQSIRPRKQWDDVDTDGDR